MSRILEIDLADRGPASTPPSGRVPKVVFRVTVQEAYLHCAQALMRSRLWSPESHVDRSLLPTLGQMINDQTGIQVPAETQEEMVKRYGRDL